MGDIISNITETSIEDLTLVIEYSWPADQPDLDTGTFLDSTAAALQITLNSLETIQAPVELKLPEFVLEAPLRVDCGLFRSQFF